MSALEQLRDSKIGVFVSLGIGGADRASFQLVLGLRDLGLEPIVITNKQSMPSRTRDQDETSQILNIKTEYESNEVRVLQIESILELKDLGLDLLHVQRSGEDFWLLPGLDEANFEFPIVETNFHGKLLTIASHRIFPSTALVDSLRGKEKNWTVIPNPIMPPELDGDFRGELNLEGKLVLGRLARSDRSVFSPSLLKIFRKIEKSHRDVWLVWVGESKWARDAAEKAGCRNIVWVPTTSSSKEISRWFRTFDIFCHAPWLGETFGNTVAEAMIHGLPCVSLVGQKGYPQAQIEVLGDIRQIAYSAKEMQNKLETLIQYPSIRAVLSSRNKRRASELYSRESVTIRYAELFHQMIFSSKGLGI